MVLKGLLVAASGFIFIFSSGIPMKLISRFRPDYKKESLYWGIGIWIITYFLGTFLQNLTRQIMTGGQGSALVSSAPNASLPYLIGSFVTTLLLQVGMLLYLKNNQKKGVDIIGSGLALGFGIGLITQVFTGMTLIGAGAGMVFQSAGIGLSEGSVQSSTIAMIANASLFSLIASLLAMILYRIALLSISSVQGYMVARSMQDKPVYFWLGIIIYILFTWAILFMQLLIGEENPGQLLGVTSPGTSIISAIYYLAVFYLCYRWLSRELQSISQKKSTKRSKK